MAEDFAGELCPICSKRKLKATDRYPVCKKCQKKHHLGPELLEDLKAHRIKVNQEEVNWLQKPWPLLSGTIDGKPWHAFRIANRWDPQRDANSKVSKEDIAIISQYLKTIDPSAKERFVLGRSKIRQYIFLVVLGGAVITAAWLWKKRITDNPPDL